MKYTSKLFACIAMILVIVACDSSIPSSGSLKDNVDSISYVIGANIGRDPRLEGFINPAMVYRGIQDVLDSNELAISDAEAEQVQRLFQMEAQRRMVEKQQELAEKNLKEGEAFLEENKTEEGVVVTESGLQYKVITEGAGVSPTAEQTVKVHYRGTLVNGEEFDSSYSRGEPTEFKVNQVIAGWTEALQLMKPGAKYQLYIPSNLGYGMRGGPTIGPNATLIFEVELLEIVE